MREFDICPCCHSEKTNTEWHFNYKCGIKVCDDCYNAMRIAERDEKGIYGNNLLNLDFRGPYKEFSW